MLPETTLSPNSHAEPSPSVVEEVDRWWGSYAGRTMVPAFVLCGLVTAAVMSVAWYLRVRHGLHFARYADLILTAPLWLALLGRWIYHLIAINYRLTTRRLFCDRGLYRTANREVGLAQITQVLVERRGLNRLLGVGRILILLQDDQSEPLRLEGVLDPEHVAMRIRHQVQHVRAKLLSGQVAPSA